MKKDIAIIDGPVTSPPRVLVTSPKSKVKSQKSKISAGYESDNFALGPVSSYGFIVITAILILSGCAGPYRAALKEYSAHRPDAVGAITKSGQEQTAAPAPEAEERWNRVTIPAAAPFINEKELGPGREINRLLLRLLATNPAITAARERVKAALATYGQERYIADTLAQIQAFTGAQSSPAASPLPQGAALRERLVILEVKQRKLELEKTIAAKAARLRSVYHALAKNRADRKIAENMLALFRSLKKALLARYSAGAAPYAELAAAAVRVERAEEKLRDLQEEEKSLRIEMEKLISGPTEKLRFNDPVPRLPAPSRAEEIAEQGNIETRLAENRLMRIQAMLDLAAATAAPDFSAGLSIRSGSDADGDFRRGVSMPQRPQAAFKPAALHYLERLRQERKAAEQALEEARRAALVRTRQLWEEADRARRRAALLDEEVIPLEESTLKAVRRAFETGAARFADLVRAGDRLLASRLELAAARMRLGLRIAELSAAAGRDLEVSP